MTIHALKELDCKPLKGREHALGDDTIGECLVQLTGWARDGNGIARTFRFDDYHRTIAFVNAVAWIAHREDHHPDLEIGYSRCRVFYSTHDVGGLSLNDFICAAKVDALLGDR